MKIVISYQQIQTKVSNKESQYLKSLITGEDFFPCSIPCNKKESGDFIKDINSYSSLMKKSKNTIGSGYLIITNKDENPNTKAFTKITKIVIESEDDFLFLLDKESEGIVFKSTILKFREAFDLDIVNEYLLNNKKSLFNSNASYVDNFIIIAKFLVNNPSSMLYPRELPTTVDTKFLEKNISSFITFIKYFRPVDSEVDKWQQIGLVNPSSTVSLRYNSAFSIESSNMCFKAPIISVEPDSLSSFTGSFKRIFILENKTTFYTFPLQEDECAIYCGGFAILMLKNLDFLNESNIYYFGDLDEHGFAILSKFRELYNNVKSFCMDLKTIKDYEKYLIEGEIYTGELKLLNENEIEALSYLKNNLINNKSSRIEQEKLSTTYLMSRLKEL
jgi:hypothetical protein